MAARTTEKLVLELLGSDHDGCSPLSPFIAAASVMVSRVVNCASSRGSSLTSDEAELLERWLAAHFYVQRDQPYASKSTGGASASFQGQTGKGIEGSKYGLTALRLDVSGCLEAYDKRKVAGGFWLGKNPDERLGWDER